MTAGPTVKLLKRIDAACDQFEEEWQAGRQPRIEDYLAQATADERPALLHALSQVQQELLIRPFEPRRRYSCGVDRDGRSSSGRAVRV